MPVSAEAVVSLCFDSSGMHDISHHQSRMGALVLVRMLGTDCSGQTLCSMYFTNCEHGSADKGTAGTACHAVL